MANQAVGDEARGRGGSRRKRRASSCVWMHFRRNAVVVSGAGAAGSASSTATATCRRCGTTLQACPRKHGTSHLRRHANSDACAQRAQAQAQRAVAPEPAGDGDDDALGTAKWIEDLLVDCDVDGHLNIIGGQEMQLEDAAGRPSSSPSCMTATSRNVPLPQVSNPSSTRFFKKKRDSYRGSVREVEEPQLRRPEEKAAAAASEIDFSDLPSILAPCWEIDCSARLLMQQEPAAAAISLPTGDMFFLGKAGDMFPRQEMKPALKQFFQKRREKRDKQRARLLADSTTST